MFPNRWSSLKFHPNTINNGMERAKKKAKIKRMLVFKKRGTSIFLFLTICLNLRMKWMKLDCYKYLLGFASFLRSGFFNKFSLRSCFAKRFTADYFVSPFLSVNIWVCNKWREASWDYKQNVTDIKVWISGNTWNNHGLKSASPSFQFSHLKYLCHHIFH